MVTLIVITETEFNAHINEFINIMSPYFLQPCIAQPTQIVSYNRPYLDDNTFVKI